MSKMSQMVMDMEEMLLDGASTAEVAAKFNISVEQVEAYIEQMEVAYEEDYEPDVDSYTEYQDLPWGGDDMFETCSFAEDF